MAVFKYLINSGLGVMGYEIRRKPNQSSLSRFSPRPSAGRILEMIGPPGVGKSTLFFSLAEELKKNWFLPHHASQLTLTTLEHDNELMRIHDRLLLKKSLRLSEGSADFWVFSGRLTYGAKVARNNIFMRSGFQRGFVLDEGLFQVVPGEFLELDKCEQRYLCAGRCLVHLSARNPDRIARQAMCRYEEQLLRGQFHHPTTFAEQSERAAKDIPLYMKVAERVQKSGGEVLNIFVED